jgi:hypothetical protein
MNATAALYGLLKAEPEYRRLFKRCCGISPARLRSQAWQFGDELLGRGYRFNQEELEDALLTLARKVLPETSAAAWDSEWADQLLKHALARMQEHYAGLSVEEELALDLSGQGPHHDRMVSAGLENDPAAFRAALREWERAGVEALKSAQTRPGAA